VERSRSRGAAHQPAPGPQLLLQTDKSVYLYDRQGGPRIILRIVNLASRPVQLARCTGIYLPVPEVWTGRGWKPYLYEDCGHEDLVPSEMGPGARLDMDAGVSVLGTFRLRAPLYLGPGREALAAAVSNTFVVY
jgi:hypothetical protein